jgi:hypothetical protein
LTVLRADPYYLEYANLVQAKVKSRNVNGWSEFSDVNTDGGTIQTEPAVMAAPERGVQTDTTKLHIVWTALEGDELRGSFVTSY